MASTQGQVGTSGALGPALAAAISEHNAALAELARAEAALEAAQQAVSASRARLVALAAGARVTGARALVPVGDGDGAEPAASPMQPAAPPGHDPDEMPPA